MTLLFFFFFLGYKNWHLCLGALLCFKIVLNGWVLISSGEIFEVVIKDLDSTFACINRWCLICNQKKKKFKKFKMIFKREKEKKNCIEYVHYLYGGNVSRSKVTYSWIFPGPVKGGSTLRGVVCLPCLCV